MSFFSELRRRNVLKVALAYLAIAALLLEVADELFEYWETPGGMMIGFSVVVAAGFAVALLVAWSFEMTPQGMKRTRDISPNEAIPYWSRRKYAALISTFAVLAGALFLYRHAHH